MDDTISSASKKGGAPVEEEIWWIHAEHINKVYQQGGKGWGFKKITYHPMIMNWVIAFLVQTSSSIYQDVAKVMMLPDISHFYRHTAKLISTEKDKAKNGLHMNTI
jgi:hypothetical protein